MLFIMIFMFFVNVKLSLVVLSGLPIFAVIMMMIKKDSVKHGRMFQTNPQTLTTIWKKHHRRKSDPDIHP